MRHCQIWIMVTLREVGGQWLLSDKEISISSSSFLVAFLIWFLLAHHLLWFYLFIQLLLSVIEISISSDSSWGLLISGFLYLFLAPYFLFRDHGIPFPHSLWCRCLRESKILKSLNTLFYFIQTVSNFQYAALIGIWGLRGRGWIGRGGKEMDSISKFNIIFIYTFLWISYCFCCKQ